MFGTKFLFELERLAEEELKRKLEEESGIISIEDTEMTGVKGSTTSHLSQIAYPLKSQHFCLLKSCK